MWIFTQGSRAAPAQASPYDDEEDEEVARVRWTTAALAMGLTPEDADRWSKALMPLEEELDRAAATLPSSPSEDAHDAVGAAPSHGGNR